MRWQVRGAGAVDGEPRAVFDGASKESASLLAQVGRWALQLRRKDPKIAPKSQPSQAKPTRVTVEGEERADSRERRGRNDGEHTGTRRGILFTLEVAVCLRMCFIHGDLRSADPMEAQFHWGRRSLNQ